VLGKAFVVREPAAGDLFDETPEAYDPERPRGRIERFEGDDASFVAALRRLAGGGAAAVGPAASSSAEPDDD
jgi:hypothetical protein